MVRHGSITDAQSKVIAHRGQYRCGGLRTDIPYPTCGELLPPCWQIDHIVPISEGGEDDYRSSNVVAVCPNCHAAKTQLESILRAKRLHEEAQRVLAPAAPATRPLRARAGGSAVSKEEEEESGPSQHFEGRERGRKKAGAGKTKNSQTPCDPDARGEPTVRWAGEAEVAEVGPEAVEIEEGRARAETQEAEAGAGSGADQQQRCFSRWCPGCRRTVSTFFRCCPRRR